MPPLSPAPNGKLASGISNTLTEANVWQTRDFTPELRWGTDNFHARLYSPYLGRFLNVDPVSGVGGGSQRTNRYTYVLNNPLSFVDPDGRTISVAADARNPGVLRQMLIETIRRPTGRADIARFAANKNFHVVYTEGSLNKPSEIMAARQGKTQEIQRGRTKISKGPDNQRSGAVVTLDSTGIGVVNPQDNGVLTTAHENYHVGDVASGKSAVEILDGDHPLPSTGPAAQHGESVAEEATDLSEAAANELLDSWLQEGSQ